MYLSKDGSYYLESINYIYFKQASAGVVKITPLFGESTTPFNKAKPVITIPSGSTLITTNWVFYLKYINLNYDQSALADKTFKGELYVDDVVCT